MTHGRPSHPPRRLLVVLALCVSVVLPVFAGLGALISPSPAGAATRTDIRADTRTDTQAGTSAGTRPAADTGSAAALTISSVSAAVLTPNTNYVMTGSVLNTGRTPITDVSVRLWLNAEALDVAGLATWAAAGTDDAAGTLVRATSLTAALAPGQSVPFSLTVSGGDLSRRAAFGPRGLAVEVAGDAVGTVPAKPERLTRQRGFVVWDPGQAAPREIGLSMVAPITAPTRPTAGDNAATSGISARQLADWAPGGRLERILAATTDTQIGWVIDPSVLTALTDTVTAAGSTGGTTASNSATTGPAAVTSGVTSGATSGATSGTAKGTAAGAGPAGTPVTPQPAPTVQSTTTPAAGLAQQRLTQLRNGLTGRSVRALAWGDPDVAALAHNGTGRLLAAGQDATLTTTTSILGRAIDHSFAWPVSELADNRTVDLLGRTKNRTIALSVDTLPANTRPGRLQLLSARPDVTALVTDSGLDTAIGDMAGGGTQPVLATQRALAILAAYSAADGAHAGSDGSAALLAALPRNWNPTDPGAMAAGLNLLRSARWVHLESLDAANQAPVTTDSAERATGHGARAYSLDYPSAARARELPLTHVLDVDDSYNEFLTYLPALVEPNPVFLPLRRAALSAVSQNWRSIDQATGEEPWTPAATRQLAAARASLTQAVDAFPRGISVATGSEVNLLTSSGELPVTVSSTLPYPVKLTVTLRPVSGRLSVGSSQQVSLPAAGGQPARANVKVPVSARANGNVDVYAHLAVPGDPEALYTSTEPIRVRVRYNWENRFLAASVVALGLLLVVGLIRTARRGRRDRVPPELVPDPDDIGREVVAEAAPPTDPAPAGPPPTGPAPTDLPPPADPDRSRQTTGRPVSHPSP